MSERFQEIDHTGDIAVRVFGSDLGSLFENAGYAMACQLADVDDVHPDTDQTIEFEADDVELLLVEWLSELLYLGERDGLVFTEFDMICVSENALRGVARGGFVKEFTHHIKAVTFSELNVEHLGDEYTTTIVFDV